MTAKERARTWREQRTAQGRCHGVGCTAPADGYYCRACRLEKAPVTLRAVRVYRITREFLSMMVTLSENRCVKCGDPKEKFHPLTCAKCRKIGRLAA